NFLFVAIAAAVYAQGSGAVRGTVKDPSRGAVTAAKVTLKEMHTDWMQRAQTDSTGAIIINGVPLGEYTLTVEHEGFAPNKQALQVLTGSASTLEIVLKIGAATSELTVTETLSDVLAADASAAPTVVSGDQIREGLPGAEQMSSLRFITETAPGAFVLHDHLHVRGGHQIDWVLNGVPIPNTNMSSNVGRTLDPKDIEEVEISQGGYGAQSGDRTFAQINILTRSGFEFSNEGDLTLTYGSFHQTNDQLNFGGHSRKFAYYVSATGNRTDLGLEPPTREIDHATGSGEGLFTSMNYRLNEKNQFAWTASARKDRFQIPVDPNDKDPTSDTYFGTRDIDQERDTFGTFSWSHTFTPSTLLTVSPFYRNSNAQYNGSANDRLVANSRNTSNYAGAQVELKYVHGRHNLTTGVYSFYQRNNLLFSLRDNTQTPSQFASVDAIPTGGLAAEYVNDQFKASKWLTLNGGVRVTHFAGVASENAVNPRVGATIEIPKIHWVLRGFYGTYYQAPPLYTVGGAVLELAAATGTFGFKPLRGERDIQREFGLTIPFHGWVLDTTHFQTSSRNFLDHDVLGASNILLPLTTPNARIWGVQASLRSPLIARRLRLHAAFADMTAQYRGQPTGGLLEGGKHPDDGTDCAVSYCYLDHDQRVNITTGFQIRAPWQMNLSGNVVYGSGVLAGDGPNHLPSHVIGDVYLSKSFAERWLLGVTVLNVSNSRFPFSLDSSFAGSHFNNPREIYGSVRYHFHF
ncbi:MAG: TonB-dependent receptor, partial [Acidobacteriota bacterium]|nr:TonB-dependent receptor [Acidobacteriota bacterium]